MGASCQPFQAGGEIEKLDMEIQEAQIEYESMNAARKGREAELRCSYHKHPIWG